MEIAVLAPLGALMRAQLGRLIDRAAITTATITLATLAAALMIAASVAALADRIGFPAASMAFAGLLALLSLSAHLVGRTHKSRRATQAQVLRKRAAASIARSIFLDPAARPFLPVAAFVAAFALGRRW